MKTTALKLLSLVSILLYASTSFAINPKCEEALKLAIGLKNVRNIKQLDIFEQIEFKKTISRIRTWTNQIRKLKENNIPAISRNIHEKLEMMDNQLFAGNFSTPYREWLELFSDTEGAALTIQSLESVVEALLKIESPQNLLQKLKEAGVSNSLAEEIQYAYDHNRMSSIEELLVQILGDMWEESVILGNNYYEYKEVRQHLENLANSQKCEDKCQASASMLLEKLGVVASGEKLHYPAIIKNIKKRPDLDFIKEIAESRQLSILTMAKRERNDEFMALVSDFGLQVMFHWLKTSQMGQKIWKMYNDQYVIKEYFPKIKTVVRTQYPGIKERFYHLKEINATVREPRDIILETMGRIVEEQTTKTWNELLAYAKENDPDFAKRMEEADKRGINHDLPLNYTRSKVGRWAPAVVFGTTVAYYYTKEKYKDTQTFESKVEQISKLIIENIQKNDTIDLAKINPDSLPVIKIRLNDQEEEEIMNLMEDSLQIFEKKMVK